MLYVMVIIVSFLFFFFLQDFVSVSEYLFLFCVLRNVILGVVGVEGSNFIVVKVKHVLC
jgi:hypothetical protein